MLWPRPETALPSRRSIWSSVVRAMCWAPASRAADQASSCSSVLKDADLIAQARTLAEQCLAQDPELSNPALADIVLDVEMDAAGDWLERT